ncbi:hypothetical protein C8P68_10484 [Mucilaginibacter yixingensis]|uniref:Uncharacterized protein n=1 Tax=Mucilaginibacter yixingensis TaxID=1295612 RepID=A0A2T5J9B4_9SPHI|nr:hypothetical protein [Mucilaginibacter yixingensis]PTQ96599.1 hypothetical protein C8P68_10484 [Mucilaginibacter yixingensis]
MKTLKITGIILLVLGNLNIAMAQMVRNKAIHFNRHRVVHHHHKK